MERRETANGEVGERQVRESTEAIRGMGPNGRSESPAPRRRRCRNPREVRLELVRVAKGLWDDELDPQKANALVNAYRVILQSLTEGDIEARLAAMEAAVERADERTRGIR